MCAVQHLDGRMNIHKVCSLSRQVLLNVVRVGAAF